MKMATMTTMMMMEEEEDEDMEIENHAFVAHEIDLDYEFDAARFFDFAAEETPDQARLAELWFGTAGSYPPSPFVAKLALREDDDVSAAPLECVNGWKAVGGKISALLGGGLQDVDVDMQMQPLQVTSTGLTFSSQKISNTTNFKAKSAVRKGSTLMKPTASQLAKQNRPPQNVASRFQKVTQNKETILPASSGVEAQASKRQKLEDGLLRKVGDMMQQTNFVHKAPKKVVTAEQNSRPTKLKITIPREPDLETAHRAQRIRPKNAAEAEIVTVAVPRFKARPLNRKILNAPSLPLPKRTTPQLPEFQEFHLKTWERAMQHSSATSSSSLHCTDSDKGLDKPTVVSTQENRPRDLRRPSAMGAPKHDGLDFVHNFKARPLNKKILSSKGDIGVFRNRKQESTMPTEFNFQTEKRVHHNLPVDLFSKLSLTSEVQSINGSQIKQPLHSRVFRKDSKENIGSSFHPSQKEKPFIFGGNQNHSGNDSSISEVGSLLSARRNMGIR